MHLISKEIEFDAGHRVPSHDGQCRNPHGHRYKVEVVIEGLLDQEEGSPQEGMVLDFSFLKVLLMEKVHDVLDHGFIVHVADTPLLTALGEMNNGDYSTPDHPYSQLVDHEAGEVNRYGWKVIVFPTVPTAENIAEWIFSQLKGAILVQGCILHEVNVWETPTSKATYV